MYDKSNIILDILKDLNNITTTILSGQNGDKPPFPYAEVNIITEALEHEYEEIRYNDQAETTDKQYNNDILLTLSITHHSKSNIDNEVNELLDYFRDMSELENKYNMAVLSMTGIQNRNTILSVEFDNIKGFDVTIRIDDQFVETEIYIEEVQL